MKYLDLFADLHWSLLTEWLAASGELLVEIYLPSSPSSSTKWFVRSLEDIRSLIAHEDWPQIEITIYRLSPYSIRGVVDEKLLQAALHEIPDNSSFSIFSTDKYYPDLAGYMSGGETHEELRRELNYYRGRMVIVGRDPDPSDLNWIYTHPKDVMQFAVRKSIHA
jgi:hypothetical protein